MIELVAGTTGQPLSLADAKTHLGILGQDDDNRVNDLIRVATDYVERSFTGQRQIMPATYDYTLGAFPNRRHIWIPRPPLQSITSVKYFDTSNVQQTWATSNYIVKTPDETQGWIERVSTASWPATYDRSDAVTIRFVAGYSVIPDSIKHALKLLVGHLNENREATSNGVSNEVAFGLQSLLAPHQWGAYY